MSHARNRTCALNLLQRLCFSIITSADFFGGLFQDEFVCSLCDLLCHHVSMCYLLRGSRSRATSVLVFNICKPNRCSALISVLPQVLIPVLHLLTKHRKTDEVLKMKQFPVLIQQRLVLGEGRMIYLLQLDIVFLICSILRQIHMVVHHSSFIVLDSLIVWLQETLVVLALNN